MQDPRHYDPSYNQANDAQNEAYQPTQYDPQFNQANYWQEQAQRYAMQAANGDKASSSSSAPLPIPPHLQHQQNVMGTTPPSISSSSKQHATPHEADHFTPPTLSRTGSPLLDKDAKNDEIKERKLVKDGSGENEEDSKESKACDHSVDLDTRLKMLMKDKSSVVPAFLFESLQADEEEEEVETANDEANNSMNQNSSDIQCSPSTYNAIENMKPLSRAPSPFLSQEHYLHCHNERIQIEQAKREKEVGRGSQKKSQGRNRGRRGRPDSRNSDAMSLSSLSSGENNILEEGPTLDPSSYYYGYPPSAYPGYYPGTASHVPGSYPYVHPGHPYDASNPPHLMAGSEMHPGYDYRGQEWGYTGWAGPNGQAPMMYSTDDPMLMYQNGKSDKRSIRPLVR